MQRKVKAPLSFFNLSSNSFINVNKIADLVIKGMKLKNVKRTHTAGKIGWKGDVPVDPAQERAAGEGGLEAQVRFGARGVGDGRGAARGPTLRRRTCVTR